MHYSRKPRRRQLLVESLEFRRLLASVDWDGGAGTSNWLDAQNWENDQLPTVADQVNFRTNPTVILASGSVTVGSMFGRVNLQILGGATLVTANDLGLQGNLEVRGVGSRFNGNITGSINGANISALSGGVVSLQGVSQYKQPTATFSTFLADGPGSRIEFLALGSIEGSASGPTGINIRATAGGVIDLPRLSSATILTHATASTISFEAIGDGSLIDLPNLSIFTDASSVASDFSRLAVRQGGRIDAARLTQLINTEVIIDGANSTLPFANFNGIQSGRIELIGAGNVRDFTALTDADGTSMSVTAGAILRAPALTQFKYDRAFGSVSWQASGGGSVIDLSHLASVDFAAGDLKFIGVNAGTGGQIDLSQLTTITVPVGVSRSGVRVEAVGVGSRVELDALNQFSDGSFLDDGDSLLSVRNGGAIDVPSLTSLTNTALTIEGAGSALPTNQFTSIKQGLIRIVGSAAVADFANLSQIESSSLEAVGGATLSLPAVSSYRNARTIIGATRLKSEGAGSQLVLPALTSIASDNRDLTSTTVVATTGGSVVMPNLTSASIAGANSVRDGICFEAHDVNSRVRMPGLVAFTDGSSFDGTYSCLSISGGGVIEMPPIKTLENIQVVLNGKSSQLPIDQLESLQGGAITVSGTDNVRQFEHLGRIDGTSLTASSGGSMSLPLIRSMDNLGAAMSWTQSGQGSQIQLPRLSSITIDGGQLSLNMPDLTLDALTVAGNLAGSTSIEVREEFDWSKGGITGSGSLRLREGASGKITGTTGYLSRRLVSDGVLNLLDAKLEIRATGLEVGAIEIGEQGIVSFDGDTTILSGGQGAGQIFLNRGRLSRSANGVATLQVPFENHGSIELLGGSIDVQQSSVIIPDGQSFRMESPSRLSVRGSLAFESRQPEAIVPWGEIQLAGNSTKTLEVTQASHVPGDAWSSQPQAMGRLIVSSGIVNLEDRFDNVPGSDPEALIVDTLIVGNGATLNLNGLAVFARSTSITGSVVGGTISVYPEGVPLLLNQPASGSIAVAGQVDQWSLWGRVGDRLQLVLDTASSQLGFPLQPSLTRSALELVAPNGQIVATATAASNGASVLLGPIVLDQDGHYLVRVRAASTLPDSVGNYLITAQDAAILEQTLFLNQTARGVLSSPAVVHRWNFSTTANQVVEFRIDGLSQPGIGFKLIGPAGFSTINDLKAIAGPFSLSVAGNYTIEVRAVSGTRGSYSMAVNTVSIIDLTVGVDFNGQVTGSFFSQVFRLNQTSTEAIRIAADLRGADSTIEIFARRGQVPTTQAFDLSSLEQLSATELVISESTRGEWYILFVARATASHPMRLRADHLPILLTQVTPRSAIAGAATTLSLAGAGFLPGTTVELVNANAQPFATTEISIDGINRLTAQFSQGVPSGSYRLRVRSASGAVAELDDAIEILESGQSEFYVTLDSPSALGRHVTATLYLEYGNRGNLPMPAPILVLQSGDVDGSDLPLFTLDAARVVPGFWATPGVVPEGVSHTLQVYASGATPGMLQPGESIRLPVYYIGLMTPFKFDDTSVELEVRVSAAGSQDAIDWPSAFASWKPDLVSEQAWQVIVANAAENIGGTQTDYVDMLASNASYLNRLGIRSSDANELMSFELKQAAGMDSQRKLLQSIDLTADGIGLQPVVDRVWLNSLPQRYELGPFGYGWTTGLQNRLQVLSNGTVAIGTNVEEMRYFQPDSRKSGAFAASSGEFGELTRLTDGSYEVREAEGLLRSFNSAGQWTKLVDSHGNRLTLTYSAGLLARMDHSSGAWLRFSHNAQQLIERIDSSSGLASIYGYDQQRRLVSVQTNSGLTLYTYEQDTSSRAWNAIRSATLPNSNHREFQYDAQGLLSRVAAGNGAEVTQFDFDEAGKLSITQGSTQTQTVYYDQFANIRRVENAAGGYFNLERDSAGRLISRMNSFGQLEEFTYSAQGLLAQYIDTAGLVHTYASSGDLAQIDEMVNASGHRTLYGYSTEGQLTSIEHADGTEELFAFDSRGLLQSNTNRRGQKQTYQFDDQGRMISRTRADGLVERIEYNTLGQMVAFTDARGRTSFQYDNDGHIVRVDDPSGRWVAYQYDAQGRKSRMEDASGFVVQYRFDANGRLAELLDGSNNRIVAYSYNTAGELIREDKGNGSATLYQYASRGFLQVIEHLDRAGQSYERIDYELDALGTVLGQTSRLGAWSYQYDSLGQLIAADFDSFTATIPDQSLRYAYDAMGNRLQSSVNGQTTAYSVNELNQYVSVGGVARGYDLDGNLVSVAGSAPSNYQYDDLGRLVSFERGVDRIEYEYDLFGNRTAIIENGVRRERLVDWSMNGVALGEFNAQGQRIKSYAFGHGIPAVQVDQAGNPASHQWQFFDYDAQGNTSSLIDANGVRKAEYVTGPFGESIHASAAVPNDLQFAGKYGLSSETGGLIYMRARYYDAVTGRFLSQDPKGLAGEDTNFYRYVGNRPTSQVDPFGTNPVPSLTTAAKWYDRYSIASDANSTYDGGKGIMSWTEPVNDALSGNPTYHDPQSSVNNLLDGILDIADPTPSLPGSPSLIRDADKLKPYLPSMQRPSLTPKGAYVFTKMNGGIDWIPTIRSYVGAAITAASLDPNDKQSVGGVGDAHFVKSNAVIPYRVRFENLGSGSVPTPAQPATAPAQRVVIEDDLSDLLDWTTVRFTGYGFGDSFFTVQQHGDRYFGKSPMSFGGEDFDVEVELTVDRASGQVRAVFQSIDPDTQLPPMVLTGFLPPEDGTGRGQGFISFEARAKPGLASGTAIRNVARITFDNQQVIATNQIDPQDPSKGVDDQREALVTIDAEAPSSQVLGLPSVSRPTFPVSWTGSDGLGSGVVAYDVYVSIDAAPAILWLSRTTLTSSDYSGQAGHSYAFFSVAIDALGQVEARPLNVDSSTAINDKPWQNTANPLDVNSSGQVTALDALLVINELNGNGPRELPQIDSTNAPPPYLDTNGDGFLSAIDALLVINHLNTQASGEGEPSGILSVELVDAVFIDWESDRLGNRHWGKRRTALY